MPFVTRFFYAFIWFFRVWFDGRFAAGVERLDREGGLEQLESGPGVPSQLQPAATPRAEPEQVEPSVLAPELGVESATARSPEATGALLLLGMLQREGRLIDFVQQDVTDFPDEQVGAAARVVHEGCRRVLADHLTVEAVRAENEGGNVTLAAGFDATAVKLTGNVQGEPPFRGVIRHRGWRVVRLKLPQAVGQGNPEVLAPAEVEL